MLRLAQYIECRSLWIDEARLSLNVASRSWLGLLAPLDYDQAAPVPFLWAQRLLVRIGGVNEYSLRFLSLLAGVLLPFLAWKLARRLLSERPALLVTALVAFSPMLIRYANEAKPYGIDALVSVWLSIMAVDLVQAPPPLRRWLGLTVGGLVAVAVSIPAVLVLAGIGLALLLAPAVRETRHGLLRVVGMGAVWLAAFGGLYIAFYRAASHAGFLQEFWEFAFLRPGAPDLAARVWGAVNGVMSGVLVGSLDADRWGPAVMLGVAAQAAAATVLWIAGTVAIARRQGWWLAALFAGPVLAAAAASAVGAYPITVRLMLFAVPGVLLLLVVGVSATGDWFSGRARMVVAAGLALCFLGPALGRALLTSISPIRQQDTRPVIAEFERLHKGSDPVYVYAAAVPAWTFYTTDWSRPDTARLRWMARQSSSGGAAFPSMSSRGHAVSGEGTELVYPYRGRQELIGIPTGRPLRWGGTGGPTAPDPGWADNEAERIRRAAGDRVWVFFMPISPGDREPNLGSLRAGLESRGGALQSEVHRREAELYLYQFPGSPELVSP
ncbi:MAG: glycosyltransferase family 39 protein [Gemmatimonadota bacterium]